jgi:hypothetical protein
MRANQTIILLLALGLASAVSAPTDDAANAAAVATNIAIQPGTSGTVAASSTGIKITGTVTDPEGKPAPKVLVSLVGYFSPTGKQTDSEGHFIQPQPVRPEGKSTYCDRSRPGLQPGGGAGP